MNLPELEEIVGNLFIFQDGRKVGDPRAQPGMTVRSVDGNVGLVRITKMVYGTWRHLIEGAPSFTSDENILEIISCAEEEIKSGDEYNIKISYEGRDMIVKAKVVTQFSHDTNSTTYLRIADGKLTDYLCSVPTRKLIQYKNFKEQSSN